MPAAVQRNTICPSRQRVTLRLAVRAIEIIDSIGLEVVNVLASRPSMPGRATVIIPVTASVDDDGLVHNEGDDLSLVRWNHRPALVRAALQRFGGRADWKPRWYLLAVPTEAFMGSARSVFNLAALDERERMLCYPHD